MRIGLIVGLHGSTAEGFPPHPTWSSIRGQVLAAEEAGFDLAVIEDALLYAGKERSVGFWEAVAIAGALASATTTIEFGHSVLNSPYRSPAHTAKIAETLDEISGGRFILGIGAGNTPDYEAFGFPADKRYSRFAEAMEIIYPLLREGRVEFEGEYQSAQGAEMVLRGPRSAGPPMVIAAGGPKMMRLAARYADEWNWWSVETDGLEELRRLVAELDRACGEVGRDPTTLRRSVDLYSVDPLELGEDDGVSLRIRGSSREIADQLLAYGELGFGEVRCDLVQPAEPAAMPATVEAMSEVVDLVHKG